MRRKLCTLISFLTVFLFAVNAQNFTVINQNFTVIKGSGDVTPNGISSDGKYVVGIIGNTSSPKAFTWDKQTGITEETTKSVARAVSSTGRVVGYTENGDKMTEGAYPEKVLSAAYHQIGESAWTLLSLTSNEPLIYAEANSAYGVSNNGAIVTGAQPKGGDIVRHFAGYWDLTDVENPQYVALPVRDVPTDPDAKFTEGSYALCVSGDGKIIGGYDVIARPNGEYTSYLKRAVLWINNEEIEIQGTSASEGCQVSAISNNGKYAVISSSATKFAVYDIENETLSEMTIAETSTALAISNDGIVVGAIGRKGFMGSDTRTAIVYSKDLGAVVTLEDYLADANIAVPEGIKLLGATGISADGKIILAYGQIGTSIVGLYIELEPSLQVYANGISSDGKYVVGKIGTESTYMFAWSSVDGFTGGWDAANVDLYKGGSIAEAVSTTGRTVGTSGNPDITSAIELWIDNKFQWVQLPIQTAAFNNFGEETWSFLPVKPTGSNALTYNYGDKAYDITDNGNIIVGAHNSGNSGGRPYATYWDVSDVNDIKNVVLFEDKGNGSGAGSAVKSVSGDGKVMGGFYNPEWAAVPVLWIDGVLTPVAGINATGVVNGVSNNGKYAVLQIRENIIDKAGMYIIETERFIPLEFDNKASNALAVSDNGIVVGHWGKTASKAFLYKESRGMMPLDEVLTELGVEYPAGFNFVAATDISADGRFICGYGTLGGKTVSFRVEIPEIEDGIFPVTEITVKNEVYGTINLEWGEVPASSSLTGYNVYCNDELIQTTSYEETSFAHIVTNDGTYIYYVTAKHGDEESTPSKTVRVTMGKKSVPFYEPFDECQAQAPNGVPQIPLSTVFWDVSANSMSFIDSWEVGASGIPAPCAFFLTPISGNYSESLTSPFIDATGAESLTLRFNMTIPGISLTDKLKVEVWDGETWTLIDDIAATDNVMNGFKPKQYNVNQLAGKDNVRIRFTCYGNSAVADLNWNIDNVDLSDPAGGFQYSPALVIGANDNQKDETVSITWADPNGVAKLKYLYTDVWTASSVGNEGEKFIAANMYPAEDLKIYENYKLTSISFMPFKVDGAGSDAEYKWYVAQDGVRLFEAPVTGAKSEVWSTIKLENPITIDVTKALYYGVEVVSHDVNDRPVATSDIYKTDEVGNWISMDIVGGKANIYSTDNGATWEELPTFTYFDPETLYEGEVHQLFCISATLEKDPQVGPKERILGYRLNRNNVNLIGKFYEDDSTLTSLTTFIDNDPLPVGDEACYRVSVFYNNQVVSEQIEVCLTREPNSIGEVVEDGTGISVYPTYTKGLVNVYAPESSVVTVIDATGKVLESRRFIGNTTLDLNYSNGVYFINVKTDTKSSSHKVLLQK